MSTVFLFLPLVFLLFFLIIYFLFPPVGLLKGPWLLEQISALKSQEHAVYWSCVIGIPLCTVALSWWWRRRHYFQDSVSPTITPAAPRSGWRRALNGIFLVMSFLFIMAVAPRNAYGPVDTMEEGHIVEAARKSEQGLRWYRDIFFIYGPGLEVVQTRIAFNLFGETLAGLRGFKWFTDPLGLAAAFAVACLLTRRKWLLALFIAVGISGARIHPRMALPLLTVFTVLLALRQETEWRKRICLWSAGALWFWAYFYSMENGPLLLLALAVPVLLIFRKESRWLAAGLATFAIPFGLWALFSARLGFILGDFFMMKTIMLSSQAKPTPILYEPIVSFFKNPLLIYQTDGVWVRWWLPPILFTCLTTWGLERWLVKDRSRPVAEGLIIGCAGVVFFFIALGRTDYDHWLKATALYWVALLWAIERFLGLMGYEARSLRSKIAGGLGVVVIGGVMLFYAQPLSLASRLKWAPGPTGNLASFHEPPPALAKLGLMEFDHPSQATMIGIVERIWKYAHKEEYVFIFSTEPLYYFLAEVNNPTRYPHSIKMVTPEAQAEVIASLKEKQPRLALIAGDGQTPPEYFQKPIMDYLLGEYEVRENFGGYAFATRKK